MIRRILSVLCGTTHLSLILECAVGSDADILGSDLGAVPYEKRMNICLRNWNQYQCLVAVEYLAYCLVAGECKSCNAVCASSWSFAHFFFSPNSCKRALGS